MILVCQSLLNMKYIVLVLVVCVSLASSRNLEFPERTVRFAGESRIVNGSPADIAQHPHHVALFELWSGGSSYFCGGSIIARHFVLSAARKNDFFETTNKFIGFF